MAGMEATCGVVLVSYLHSTQERIRVERSEFCLESAIFASGRVVVASFNFSPARVLILFELVL